MGGAALTTLNAETRAEPKGFSGFFESHFRVRDGVSQQKEGPVDHGEQTPAYPTAGGPGKPRAGATTKRPRGGKETDAL
jgi:hypothetical protein